MVIESTDPAASVRSPAPGKSSPPESPPVSRAHARNAWPEQDELRRIRQAAVHHAVNELFDKTPRFSARIPVWWRQVFAIAGLTVVLSAAMIVVPSLTAHALLAVIAIPFAMLAVFRALAVGALWRRPNLDRTSRSRHAVAARPPSIDDPGLPHYTVLVPLYDEANMVGQIVEALAALDYPPERLQVLILIEESDQKTRVALRHVALPLSMQAVLIPPAAPRTKPKALNVGLQFATGDYVVVYDAEDLPDPQQLRQAVAGFARGGSELGCLQARLVIHNARENWLTRQFALEYLSLFDGLLPTYQALGLPMPLGGTSNHFPRRVLQHIGAWDSFNVTEDADIGVRLARYGYAARMLDTRTLEEAPHTLRGWFCQRTRWLKGWMQTWLVHTRQPFRLIGDLGIAAATGFHAIVGGMILAALVHPIVYILLVWQVITIGPFALPASQPEFAFTCLAAFNLCLGYLSAVALGLFAALRRRQMRLLGSVVSIPIYWLLISAAAWRALFQLIFDPFRWEKTSHRAHN